MHCAMRRDGTFGLLVDTEALLDTKHSRRPYGMDSVLQNSRRVPPMCFQDVLLLVTLGGAIVVGTLEESAPPNVTSSMFVSSSCGNTI